MLLAGCLGGCASPGTPYMPDAAAARMSVDQARATLRAVHGDFCPTSLCTAFQDTDVESIEVAKDGALVFVGKDGNRSRRLPLRVLTMSCERRSVHFSDGSFLLSHNDDMDIKRVCDALAVVKQAQVVARQQAAFAAIAKAYRAAAVKPMPGEDVRRYVVQAQAAVREERFADAAAAYEKALAIAPWWPEGHYNRAFILAATGNFAQAIDEMQDYLALVPDAPNARQMQDQVYEWQAKVPAAASAPAAAPELEPGSLAGRLGGALSK